MRDQGAIIETLQQLIELLELHSEPAWARALRELAQEYPSDPSDTAGNIRRLYGGMGSFGDVVLYRLGGEVPIEENEQLNSLRSKLFDLASTYG